MAAERDEPVGTAAIVYAYDREHAKRLLLAQLRVRELGPQQPDEWTLEPITPVPAYPVVRVLLDGNY